jgi:hypothetical protein
LVGDLPQAGAYFGRQHTLKRQDDLQRNGDMDGIRATRDLIHALRHMLPCWLRAGFGRQMTLDQLAHIAECLERHAAAAMGLAYWCINLGTRAVDCCGAWVRLWPEADTPNGDSRGSFRE